MDSQQNNLQDKTCKIQVKNKNGNTLINEENYSKPMEIICRIPVWRYGCRVIDLKVRKWRLAGKLLLKKTKFEHASKIMRTNKTPGPDNMNIEILQYARTNKRRTI